MSRTKRKATIFQNIGRNQSFNEVVKNILKANIKNSENNKEMQLKEENKLIPMEDTNENIN